MSWFRGCEMGVRIPSKEMSRLSCCISTLYQEQVNIGKTMSRRLDMNSWPAIYETTWLPLDPYQRQTRCDFLRFARHRFFWEKSSLDAIEPSRMERNRERDRDKQPAATISETNVTFQRLNVYTKRRQTIFRNEILILLPLIYLCRWEKLT